MMRMRTNLTGLTPMNGTTTTTTMNGGSGDGDTENWEVRPCGMLVQKRLDEDENTKPPPPTIRVRVKYGSIYHDIHINSQASIGELKKKLSEVIGLHHLDQKVYYKGKERDSKQYLDMLRIKDKSKLVVVEDAISQEKRYLEMRRTATLEKAAKSVSQISLEVDRLAGQVAALESVISKGGRVAEKEIVNLIELLMNELIKLDGIITDGDVKLQRKMQVTRVQKFVETLDMLKIKNSKPSAGGGHTPNQNSHNNSNGHTKNSMFKDNGQSPSQSQERASSAAKPPRIPKMSQRHHVGHSPLKPKLQEEVSPRNSTSGTVVTTQWETFEPAKPLVELSPTSSSTPPVSRRQNPKFPWDLLA